MNKYLKGDIYNAMNFVSYITTVLLSLQPPYGDGETWQQRSDRMAIVAEAIDTVVDPALHAEAMEVIDDSTQVIIDRKSTRLNSSH